MARAMGIDYGQKRVGFAVSDPLGLFATALETVPVAGAMDFIKQYLQKEAVSVFVVGYPRHLNHTPSQNAARVEDFVKYLHRTFPHIPVELEDERFTSKMAQQALIDGGMKKKDRQNKANVDRISAVLILQTYLQRL